MNIRGTFVDVAGVSRGGRIVPTAKGPVVRWPQVPHGLQRGSICKGLSLLKGPRMGIGS